MSNETYGSRHQAIDNRRSDEAVTGLAGVIKGSIGAAGVGAAVGALRKTRLPSTTLSYDTGRKTYMDLTPTHAIKGMTRGKVGRSIAGKAMKSGAKKGLLAGAAIGLLANGIRQSRLEAKAQEEHRAINAEKRRNS